MPIDRFRRHSITALALTALVAVTGPSCGQAPDATGDDSPGGSRVTIVCTTTMIGDIAQEIAGDLADVHVLLGPTIDPHLFRATRKDVALLMDADLVIYNGFGLEGHLEHTLQGVTERGIDLLAIAEVILQEGEPLDDAGIPDPHVWMDPSLWARTAPAIASALASELPSTAATAEALNSRAAAVEGRLHALDQSAAKSIGSIPDSTRTLVTAHDAFRYFGRRYDLKVEGIQGLSTASESGLHALESLVTLLVDSKIPAVFFESTVSERNVKALIEGAAARDHTVNLGGTLHSDAPGAAGTYEAMMKHNIVTITGALGGTAAGTAAATPAAIPVSEVQE